MKYPTTYRVAKISCRADLRYLRDRDEGRCKIGKFSNAHVAVVAPDGALHIEVLTTNIPPRWCAISPQMRPNEIEKAIRKSATISPQFKAVYLAMLDVGANAKGKETR